MLSAHNSPLFGFLYHITFTLWFRLLLWYANHARQYLNWCTNVFICISSSIWLCGMCNTRDDSIKVNWAALTVNFILSEMSCGNLFQCNIVKLGKFLRVSGYDTYSVRWEWIIVVLTFQKDLNRKVKAILQVCGKDYGTQRIEAWHFRTFCTAKQRFKLYSRSIWRLWSSKVDILKRFVLLNRSSS